MLIVNLVKEEKKIMPVVKKIDILTGTKKTFFLLSLGRSGHHAVMNWICEQSRPSCYFNNCTISDGEICSSELYKYIYTIEKIKGKSIDVNDIDVNLCIINTINISIDALYKKLNRSNINVIIVVRDCYNWVASRLKYGGGVYNKTSKLSDTWKELVKTCLYKNIEMDTNLIDINFNKWFTSKKYRKKIAKNIGINFTDKGVNFVEHIGKSKFEPNIEMGQDLDVLYRYKYVNSAKLKDGLDTEMIELTKKYFNMKVHI